jgi:hypothetical protein
MNRYEHSLQQCSNLWEDFEAVRSYDRELHRLLIFAIRDFVLLAATSTATVCRLCSLRTPQRTVGYAFGDHSDADLASEGRPTTSRRDFTRCSTSRPASAPRSSDAALYPRRYCPCAALIAADVLHGPAALVHALDPLCAAGRLGDRVALPGRLRDAARDQPRVHAEEIRQRELLACDARREARELAHCTETLREV